jgi:hypothetical protein
MIDLHSVIAFFHKAKWTELAVTHEIHCMLGENTVGYSAVRKYVRTFVITTKEIDTLVIPGSEGDFNLHTCIALALSEVPFLSLRQIAEKVMMSK